MSIAATTDAEIQPADLLITTALLDPPERAPYLQAEVAAFCELSKILADDPRVALRRFLEVDDASTVEQLQAQQVLALKLLDQAREHRHALALLESQGMAQRAIIRALAEEHRRREYAAASEREMWQAMADVAIREGHRRIRNTIQIAASLLSLQARATPCAQVHAILQERYGRLRLLDKVHELLYASAVSTQAIVMPALLQAMGDALRQSFAEMSGRVRLQVTSDTIVLSADEAIPMALLANEVVTNAYRHAFPQGHAGEIAINFHCAPENALVLQVRDNGIGMRSTGGERGLGLKLVRTCAAQLHGTLAVSTPIDAAGTVITLMIHRGRALA